MSVKTLKADVLARIIRTIENTYGQAPVNMELGFPPNVELGHFSFACFPLAKHFHESPVKIAETIAKDLSENDMLQKVKNQGPYINITIKNSVLFKRVLDSIIEAGGNYGASSMGTGKRVMTEYLSPNTNKPLHLGHLRNGSLGMAISNILKITGHHVVKANLINDRGIHICKSMLAWKRWGEDATPESTGIKGDHFVGNCYVRYAKEESRAPELNQEIKKMLQKWEAGDSETVNLWKTMNQWVYDGFSETYKNFGLEFDAFYYESETYKLGKDIIADGIEKKVFKIDQRGNTVFHLPMDKFGQDKENKQKKITVLRPDSTSLYITQDLGTSLLKITDHNLSYSIYVVGSEQEHHFNCLFEILQALGYQWAKDCFHLSYGMVYLPEGKMKSREGKSVDADDLIKEMNDLAIEELKKRDPEKRLSSEEICKRATKISIGAIKFYLLRVRPTQNIHFNPVESISFDGFTGPYCQYSYARIFGILEKAKKLYPAPEEPDYSLLGNEEEVILLQKLIQFPDEILSSLNEFNPSRLAVHIFNTAKSFNQFYNKHHVIRSENKRLTAARLVLIHGTAHVLKNGLNLLGIDVLKNM